MSDSESIENPVTPADRVLDPDEVQIPREVQERINNLIDAGRVVMIVGDGDTARPMTLPQLFQEMFAILGDLDNRLSKMESGRTPGGLVLPN